MNLRPAVTALLLIFISAALLAQEAGRLEFDVVSIRRNTSGALGNRMRTLPDGTQVMTNTPVRAFILAVSPVQTREIIGLPDWAISERYDFTMKPPAGATPEQHKQMMQTMFADRMRLAAHIEQRERDVFMLALARSDSRLGPGLTPSTLDCLPGRGRTPPPLPPPEGPITANYALSRCGFVMMTPGAFASGWMNMSGLAGSLSGLVGADVENQTGLDGYYAVNLTFARLGGPAASSDANVSFEDAPDIFTAVKEQLGLKLQREKKMMPVFVIDHIERPSEN